MVRDIGEPHAEELLPPALHRAQNIFRSNSRRCRRIGERNSLFIGAVRRKFPPPEKGVHVLGQYLYFSPGQSLFTPHNGMDRALPFDRIPPFAKPQVAYRTDVHRSPVAGLHRIREPHPPQRSDQTRPLPEYSQGQKTRTIPENNAQSKFRSARTLQTRKLQKFNT